MGRRGEVRVFDTPTGPVHALVVGDTSHPALVTYHDIGLSGSACFDPLFEAAGEKSLLATFFCQVHVHFPGHLPGSMPPDATAPLLTMDDLAAHVHEVVEQLGLPSVILMGCGAGADVLVRYAVRHKGKVEGLLLFGAMLDACGWGEWFWHVASTWTMSTVGVPWVLRDQLVRRYFSPHTLSYSPQLATQYHTMLDQVSPVSLMRFVQAYERRTEVENLARLDRKTLLFIGKETYYYGNMVAAVAKFHRPSVAYIEVEHAGIVLPAEDPPALLRPIELFLQGLGYVKPAEVS